MAAKPRRLPVHRWGSGDASEAAEAVAEGKAGVRAGPQGPVPWPIV